MMKIARLAKALSLMMALPTFEVSGQHALRRELKAFVGAHGHVDSTKLPDGVRS